MSRIINAIANGDEQGKQLATMLREVYRRAMTDPTYRELALNDATAALRAAGGGFKGWNFKFIEAEEGVEDVFVLPPAIETAPELSEEELEAVAGGDCCTASSEAEVVAHRL